MSITRFAVPLLAAVALLPVVPAVAAAGGLSWQLCSAVARGWDPDDQRTECALVPVPVDYADPGGPKIDLAVSRIRATGERAGAVLLNPGGPGQSGLGMPGSIADSHAGGIGLHHDLVGFDPRGVGYSADLPCQMESPEPDPGVPDRDKAREAAERIAKANRECVDAHPAFVRNLTTPTIARDMDRIREALGEDKIGYYGVSWGTALGAQYRSLFDEHVDKMLLDSVMPPDLSVTTMDDDQATAGENTFHDFASWIARYDSVYHFGTTEPQVAKVLLELRDKYGATVNGMLANPRREWPDLAKQLVAIRAGDQPVVKKTTPSGFGWDGEPSAFNHAQQAALLCNESPSPRDFDTIWQHRLDHMKRLPVAGGYGLYEQLCVGWPLAARPWVFEKGTSPLQLVGHLYEPVTPIGWALAMQHRIGGALMTVEDDAHGSLSSLPCADAAVTFFDTGRTTSASCAGAPTPKP
ncbi:alpha/beta hydrolase [Amycolatopsis sp. OK19-0408]|uniref:Alpha/beta hydrolase n=1 Tax=Amycolatopsis iheyensis TaxID=2945988 RepID=A0A9X2NPM2_9PSEU|nr:alpha/beta hydrolase [Amycolatopsis iheyensis]MCR6489375.1 alpha/beta hydrolase [Amycolatopsis iheyensis]